MTAYERHGNENPFIPDRNEKIESRSGCFSQRHRALITHCIGVKLGDPQFIGSGIVHKDIDLSPWKE
jgi:hypothetical protein